MTARRYGPFPYSAIIDRPQIRWPDGARLAVWVVLNVEFFALDEIIPAAAGGGGAAPDIPGWSARDYGNRVGLFRIMEVLARHGVRATVALNADICREHPRIVEECLRLDWELMGHNERNALRLNAVPGDEEARIVRETVETIREASGRPVSGWLSSGLAETWSTLDHLADAGIEYVADWVNDDQPYPMSLTDGRTLMSVPYSLELNDKPAFEKRGHSVPEFQAMIERQFDVLYAEGAKQARTLTIALHPYITGVPHRIAALDRALTHMRAHAEVTFATGKELARAGRSLWGCGSESPGPSRGA